MAKSKPMTDDDLRALTDSEMRVAIGYGVGKMASQREKALVYYYGLPELDLAPPEIDGRSKAVSPDVRNTIESMLPQLMVKFAGSDTVVEFEPTKPGEEQKAEQATDYVNHIYNVKNDGERITYVWMKDALISKNGIIKVWWDTSKDETREEYRGMSDVELAQLMDDEEVEVTEQKSYPDEDDAEDRQKAVEQLTQQLQQAQAAPPLPNGQPNPQAQQAIQQLTQQLEQIKATPEKMLFDVVCTRTKSGGRVHVENVPPEEFLIARDAKSIADARFVGHKVRRTHSQLKSEGYPAEAVDRIANDDSWGTNIEAITRRTFDDEQAWLSKAPESDESNISVWVTECYIKCDYDGDGISELRRVVRAGNEILANEVVDVAPFVSITPVPMPHRFFGLSIADLSEESQRIKTSILRGMLDNMYLQINGRYFAVEGQANLDDLLTSRPGGVVRMKAPGMAGRLDQGMGDSQIGMSMMEYMQGFLEDASGWTRYNQGSDGDSLNQTATGVNMITNRADMRLDMIARNFAVGFRDLFKMILKLVSQYQDKEQIVKLRGQWVPCDPREWRNGFETVVNVGIGTGNKDQQVNHLMALLNEQRQVFPIGAANAQNIYEAEKELTKALGFKSPDKFFQDPSKSGPMPDPNQAQLQADMKKEEHKGQITLQVESQKIQANAQLEAQKMQMQERVDVNRQQAEAQQKQLEIQQEAELERYKAELETQKENARLQFEQWKTQFDANTKIQIEHIKRGEVLQPDIITPLLDAQGQINRQLATAIGEMLQAAVQQIRAPRRIVRDANGRAQGLE